MTPKPRIAFTRASGSDKYMLYPAWLKSVDANIECIDLWSEAANSSEQELQSMLESCDGLVCTGGADVEPHRYGKAEEASRCHVDAERDNFEFRVLEIARTLAMPILGICRGAQLINVAYGGTLVVDIPEDHPSDIGHAAVDQKDARHDIEVEIGSILKRITRCAEGTVNSAHHQAVDQLAPDFVLSARSADGIVEAFESLPTHGVSSVLAVQWHPERLELENVFSRSVAQHFCFECLSYSQLVKSRG